MTQVVSSARDVIVDSTSLLGGHTLPTVAWGKDTQLKLTGTTNMSCQRGQEMDLVDADITGFAMYSCRICE